MMAAKNVSKKAMKGGMADVDQLVAENRMSAGVHSLWEQEQLLDYTIQVVNHEFRVHKVIMASMSAYFRALLTGGLAESGKDRVLIEGVEANIVRALIHYIYTNNMDITKDNATDVLNGALYLQIEPVIEKCTQFIIDNLDSNNCFDVLTLFRSYGLMGAVKDVKNYIKRNVRAIVKVNCVLAVSKEDFRFVVDNWQSSEMDLFKLILKWTESDEDRNKHVDDLLCVVRYSLMTPKQLSEVIDMKQSCTNAKGWHALVDKACEYHKLPIHQRVPDTSQQTKVRSAPSFLSFSCERGTAGYFYEPLQQRFERHEDLVIGDSMGRFYDQIEVNNFLVVCASSTEDEDWHIFDPRTSEWGDMAKLGRLSTYATFAHNSKQLYVVGGVHDQDQQLQDVYTDAIEQYNFKTDKWRTFSWMPVPVKYCGACIIGDGLYISGGVPVDASEYDRKARLTRMDRLDLLNCQWENKAPLLAPRFHHSMHIMKILGENVICVIDNDVKVDYCYSDLTFVLEYYKPEINQWFRCTFTLNRPLEVRTCHLMMTGYQWLRGNSIFLLATVVPFSQNKEVSAVLRFPEEGTEASVDYVVEIEERFDAAGNNVLQIVPYIN